MKIWSCPLWLTLCAPWLVLGAEKGVQPCPLDAERMLFVQETAAGDKLLTLDGKEIAAGEAPRLSPDGAYAVFLVGGLFPEARLYDVNAQKVEIPAVGIYPDRDVMWTRDSLLVWQEAGVTRAYDVRTQSEAKFAELPADTVALAPDGTLGVRVVDDADGTPALELFTVADGKMKKRISGQSGWRGADSGGAHSPVFSGDGKFLAWVDAGIQPLADIRMLNLATDKEFAVTTDGRNHQHPAFEPGSATPTLFFSTLEDGGTVLQRVVVKLQ